MRRWFLQFLFIAGWTALPGWLILALAPRGGTWSVSRTLGVLPIGLLGLLVVGGAVILSSDLRHGNKAVALFAIGAVGVIGHFSSLYWQLAVDADAFETDISTRLDAVYFTLTTFTTTGFGDIAPTSQASRTAVSAQMLVSLLTVAGFGAALVGRMASTNGARPQGGNGRGGGGGGDFFLVKPNDDS